MSDTEDREGRTSKRAGSDNDCWVVPDIATDCGNFRLRMSSDDSRIEFSNIPLQAIYPVESEPHCQQFIFGNSFHLGVLFEIESDRGRFSF